MPPPWSAARVTSRIWCSDGDEKTLPHTAASPNPRPTQPAKAG